jgi:hypothetical protein
MPKNWHLNRKSYHGNYIYYGLPFNVVGRTGIAGRGDLSSIIFKKKKISFLLYLTFFLDRWGPNHNIIPILTRYKDRCVF